MDIKTILTTNSAFTMLPHRADVSGDVYVFDNVIISIGNATFNIALKSGNKLYYDGTYIGRKNANDEVLARSNTTPINGTRIFFLSYDYVAGTIHLCSSGIYSQLSAGIYNTAIAQDNITAGRYTTWDAWLAGWNTYPRYIKCGFNIIGSTNGVELRWQDPVNTQAPYYAMLTFQTNIDRVNLTSVVDAGDIGDYRPTTDPYEPGGISGPGGGDGTFDFSSTPVDFVGAPTIGAYDTGMVNLYVPSAADLRSLSAYLWAGAFDLDNFKRLVTDPMDAVIGLSILPLTAAQIGTTASTLAVGNISTGISMPRASSQYVTVDCGSIQILPKWGAYLDFSPYSKLQLYLPYIGIVDISPDDCMNGTIAVRYTVDILSGTCYAQVKCNDHVLYNYGATCSTTCPVTSGQYQNVAFAALGAIGGIAGAAISGMAGNVGGVTGGIENAANSVLSSFKPDVSRSGGAGGSAGLMGHQIPYLILTVPRMCTPGYQNEFIGYPSYSTQTLGDLSGYTEIDSIHPAGIPCSEDELAEIVELLNGGVFL